MIKLPGIWMNVYVTTSQLAGHFVLQHQVQELLCKHRYHFVVAVAFCMVDLTASVVELVDMRNLMSLMFHCQFLKIKKIKTKLILFKTLQWLLHYLYKSQIQFQQMLIPEAIALLRLRGRCCCFTCLTVLTFIIRTSNHRYQNKMKVKAISLEIFQQINRISFNKT